LAGPECTWCAPGPHQRSLTCRPIVLARRLNTSRRLHRCGPECSRTCRRGVITRSPRRCMCAGSETGHWGDISTFNNLDREPSVLRIQAVNARPSQHRVHSLPVTNCAAYTSRQPPPRLRADQPDLRAESTRSEGAVAVIWREWGNTSTFSK